MRLPMILAGGAALSALLATAAGCGCLFGRAYGPEEWRELRRVNVPLQGASVDGEGFYPPAVCARLCQTFDNETRGRCYPVEYTVPVPPERITACNYLDGWPYEVRRPMPRAAAEAARLGEFGHLDEATCARWSSAPDRRLNFCELEPDVPPPPPANEAFVVCTFHRPGGCDMIIR